MEAMLREWMQNAEPVSYAAWRARSSKERAGELLSRLWSRYM